MYKNENLSDLNALFKKNFAPALRPPSYRRNNFTPLGGEKYFFPSWRTQKRCPCMIMSTNTVNRVATHIGSMVFFYGTEIIFKLI